ncbi:MAG: NUDIX domain-containing protein [Lacticaseibacillus songhuajiangensis]|nr:NUDIX domain-containing protein [Lacticaseibacillus songhuajiangensis]
MKDYTLIALQTPVGVVAINRRKVPFRGMWNLIGGKVEPGEQRLTGAARETFEETGVRLDEARFTELGKMDWVIDDQLVGTIYLYSAVIGDELQLPRMTREGLLAALDPDWLALPDNQGSIPDMHAVLPLMMSGKTGMQLTARYAGDDFLELTAQTHD